MQPDGRSGVAPLPIQNLRDSDESDWQPPIARVIRGMFLNALSTGTSLGRRWQGFAMGLTTYARDSIDFAFFASLGCRGNVPMSVALQFLE